MRIAISTWNGRVSPVFDTARTLLIAELQDGVFIRGTDESFAGDAIPIKAARLRGLGVEMLVCGAISRSLADAVVASGIRLVPFVAGDIEEVLGAIAANRIPETAFSMPGCRCRRQGRGGGMGRCARRQGGPGNRNRI